MIAAQRVVALAGSPNAGKSALFNALTGANQKVGNYPGVTVEKKVGRLQTDSGVVQIIDLPGTYSLVPQSPDEEVAVKVLSGEARGEAEPALIVAVADATNLERTLGLVLDLKSFGKPVIVALNMMDLAQKRGLRLDLKVLAKELGSRVVPTVAIRKGGVEPLIASIEAELKLLATQGDTQSLPARHVFAQDRDSLTERYRRVDEILARAVLTPTQADLWTARIDAFALHPVMGGVVLAGVLFLIFQAVFAWAEAPMSWIESGFAIAGEMVSAWLPEGLIQSLVVDGMIAGVGSVIIFLPQILILFLFIFVLEGSGYMMRAAFMIDRLMSVFGLRGRSFVPLLSSFACAIPGIMATRTIRNERDRLLTILIAPLMTCSARLPVYVLLIGAFIPNTSVYGLFGLQGLVMFGLFIVGIASAMVVALVYTKLQGSRAPVSLIMELPSYKIPSLRYIAYNLWQRTSVFLRKAGTIILFVSISLWVLATFPKPPPDYEGPAINYSFVGRIGRTIEPLVAPVGFDWRIATGLIPGFAAREVMVGALGTVFAVENAEDEVRGMQSLQEKMREAWPLATALALLAWYIFAPQCLATFAVVKRETNGWRYPTIMFVYMLVLAYAAAFVTFHVTSFLS